MTDIRKFLHRNPNTICDVCGRKRKQSETILAYGTGDIPIIVSCRDGCADYRHPLNTPPPLIFDGRPVPNARSDVLASAAVFISVTNPSGGGTGQTSQMTWGKLIRAPKWSQFNLPNNSFNLNGVWTWGNFH